VPRFAPDHRPADLVVDVAILGAGAAGLSLLDALAPLVSAGPGLTVAVVEPTSGPVQDRTWCSWAVAGPGSGPGLGPGPGPDTVATVAAASWRQVEVLTPGRRQVLDLTPYHYRMVRSGDYRAAVESLARTAGVQWITGAVREVQDGSGRAVVRTDSRRIAARWVFDSRPVRLPPARTTLLQHFRGWTITTAEDRFDAGRAILMDFRTRQPAHGVSFGYLLPTGSRRALVEYTEFSRRPLTSQQYDDALAAYLADQLGLTDVTVSAVETGVIPMTDGHFRRRAGRRVFRIGTAGGATRPSTGYTFSAVQRQAGRIADRLCRGKVPVPPRAYPARHAAMDAVLLYALDRRVIDGAEFFPRLFARNPPARVLRFLDGRSRPAEELRLMATAPRRAMLRATLGRALPASVGTHQARHRDPQPLPGPDGHPAVQHPVVGGLDGVQDPAVEP
jgi:lycopene beta-cyclase